MKYSILTVAVLSALSFTTQAQTITSQSTASTDNEVEVIQVRGVRQKLQQDGRLKDVIQKTEVLDELMIKNKNALSLTQAINNEPGINVSDECSMCGVKRIMLNGMKGEHTTILVDGLPTHTMISGYYAVDAVPTTGVDRIETARGAGASLIAPEAIGGTVNIVTKQAYENQATVDVSKGAHGVEALKGMATGVSEDGRTGLTLVGQYDKKEQEDLDDNGVSESPFQENFNLSALVSHDLNDTNNLHIRVAKLRSEIFGGPVIGDTVGSIQEAISSYDGVDSDKLFEGNNVNNRYIGKAWETTEWIETNREEAYIKWLTELSAYTTSEFSVSYAKHDQDSFYEGIDYRAKDTMLYGRAKFDTELNDNHFLSYGADFRTEEMRSHTQALQNVPDYVSDSFDYDVKGLFVQDTWTPIDDIEIAMALRVDKITADFIDEKKPGVEIDKTFVAPRIDMRYFHSDTLTSRLSVGRGYRAPLSFFETDHGILDSANGYLIEVDSLEDSVSANYALSYDADDLTSTFSIAHSNVKNLASLHENEDGVPVLSQLEDDASVTTVDLVAGYSLSDNLTINGSVEYYDYNDVFRSSYTIAPVETRAGIEVEWKTDDYTIFWNTTWFGSRDLTDYGYEGYDIKGDLSSLKTQNAPAFSVSDIKVQYNITGQIKVYGGLSNIFDYTQIGNGDSPLFYDQDGNYDVAYIYGPLHGRELYVGIEGSL
ncbi:TonB-dependent receptor plug domain-containing protein [Shewanella intestini]|uniref:TonB-dependent receptor n=1 Tax=Shewanella intestini TaxID=2017544 RepID=A0ABS5I6Z3_9GAMM|nr:MULTISPECIES: TonB-dependent receptor [Shewanella]MBR9729110.1 TonB-dependent receptor [Shewanella intestini]MRG37186.1 TonB-dependent receptor plug domain-containing protein [Shewanella sp. XMDDZSB0408]